MRREAADAVRLLGSAEERARYARVPLPAAGLRAALGAAPASISRSATRWARIRAVVLPPSVSRRWRAHLARELGGVVAGAGRGRIGLVG